MQTRNRFQAQLVRPGIRERLEYRAVVAIAFMLCLGAVALRRLTGSHNEQSMMAEAYSTAMAAIGYAYTA